MKQVVQHMDSGGTELLTVPMPHLPSGALRIRTHASLISAGTERMLVGFGKASYLEKARQQPEKVRMVLEKARTDGIATTLEAVRSKLAQPLPLGYCNVGVVTEVGSDVTGFKAGDRVVSNGPHAEYVCVASNLCARVPFDVETDAAAFVVLASIGLQGIRLAAPTLGECFVVAGAGLIGLLTIQLLRAHGCRVLALDFDERRLSLAQQFGASTCNLARGEEPYSAAMAFSRGNGVDGVLITASTKSSDPVTQAARMCRKRGRIVLVGVTGLELNRADFYEKELTFQVSCSYGPGRYDRRYEEQGLDYPIGHVRWTEQRNFEAVLDMLATQRLDVEPLISHRLDFNDAPKAYDLLTNDSTALGILLLYRSVPSPASDVSLLPRCTFRSDRPVIGVIGAGNYAARMLIPALKRSGAQLHTVVTFSGLSGVIQGKKAGFATASTDTSQMLDNSDINTVVIATRHDSHSALAVQALLASKHVFVEKPLAIDSAGVDAVRKAYQSAQQRAAAPQLMVGYNRRFAPHIQRMKSLLASISEPKAFIMTMNAGAIPPDHWTQELSVGGGRIIGEACHYIDLMRFLAGYPIISAQARRMGDSPSLKVAEDKASITLSFADGSFGTILYLANGAPSFAKERIEVFAAGRVLQLDNFRRLKGYGWPGFRAMNLWKQDKGQAACASAFLHALGTGVPAIPSDEIFEVAEVTIQVAEMLRSQ